MPAGAAGEFSSPELTVSVPPPCYRSGTQRPWSFCQKCRWQVTPKHAYTCDSTKSEWADYAAVQAQCENLSGNELTFNLLANIRPQSFQLAEPLWTDPGRKSEYKDFSSKYFFLVSNKSAHSIMFNRVERTSTKSQHMKLTLEKKILPPLLLGFELATVRSRVRRCFQQAIPAHMAERKE